VFYESSHTEFSNICRLSVLTHHFSSYRLTCGDPLRLSDKAARVGISKVFLVEVMPILLLVDTSAAQFSIGM
jgi:hypothetical protein